ncbi:MAG: type II toxin-antitoxin system HicA family toxin [Candidatus Pacebacteria bacterium]|nr:type II toxin-antitoxin system HicA family toxin [Candidatus Paceibacterota bacterium]
MPSPLRGWSSSDVIKFLKKNGFVLHRSSGSHFHYKKQVGSTHYLVTVAFHGNKDIPMGTLNSIVRQSGIPKNQWQK